MFELDINQPHGYAYYDELKKLRFEPPVYLQRYSAVMHILDHPRWKTHFRKVARIIWLY